MKYYLGIDIGGTKTAYGLFDEEKRVISKSKIPTDTALSAKMFFDGIINFARHFTEESNVSWESVTGIGIGIPSFVNFETGHVIKSGSIPLIKDFQLKKYLQEILPQHVAIAIDNDGNTGALAELRQGSGQGFEHLVFCLVSTGIGTGIIINRALFRGNLGLAGESGHMLINVPEYEHMLPVGVCGCNNAGCFNSMCSGKMITHHVKHWIESGEDTIIAELAGGIEKITAEHIGKAYMSGDILATRAINQMVKYIAIWLYNTYLVLNINCFVFSGGLLSLGSFFIERIEKQFDKYNQSGDTVHFLTTRLDSDAGIIGAMELLFDS